MAKNINHVSHKKSKLKVNGKPQLPSSDAIVEGEIAVNYAEDVETLSIKNESGTVVTFSSDNYFIETNFGSGFTGDNSGKTITEAINEIEGGVVDQVIDSGTSASTNAVSTKAVYNAMTDNELVWTNAYVAMSGAVSSHTSDDSIHLSETEKTNIDALATNIGAISSITQTKVSNWDATVTSAHNHSNKSAIDSITGPVGTMAYQNTSSYSSATEVNAALADKVNTSDVVSAITSGTSASTYPVSTKAVMEVITDNELVVSNALNDLNTNKFGGVDYDSINKRINFYQTDTSGTPLAYIDATDFIKDGMVQNVEISGGNLVITFNTDAGKEAISIPLTNIFDPNNYYDKTATDTAISAATSGKADTSVTDAISGTVTGHTADATIHFTTGVVQTQIDNSISGKVNVSDVVSTITSENSASTNPVAVKVVAENELVVSNALNGLNSAITAHTADTSHMTSTEKTNLDSLATNIGAISGITSTKVSNWDTAYDNNHTHSNKKHLDGITGGVGTMAYQNASSYSSATEVNAAVSAITKTIDDNEYAVATSLNDLNTRIGTGFSVSSVTEVMNTKVDTDLLGSGFTTENNVTKVMESNEKVVSKALNRLEDMKADWTAVDEITAMLGDGFSQSYTVSDVIESNEKVISTALNYLDDNKANISDIDECNSRISVLEEASTTPFYAAGRVVGSADSSFTKELGDRQGLLKLLSHLKVGTFDWNGNLTHECKGGRLTQDVNGNTVAINGVDGDVLLYTDVPIYHGHCKETFNGSNYNMLSLGLLNHMIGTKSVQRLDRFAIVPHYTVNAQLTGDTRSCAHSVYNTGVTGTYGGHYQFFQQTVKNNGNGYPNQYMSSLNSSVQARNKNTDPTVKDKYIGLAHNLESVWWTAMYLEMGTLDFTDISRAGYGCTYTYADASTFADNGISGISGFKVLYSGGNEGYYSIMHHGFKDANGSTVYINGGIESAWYSFTEMLEGQRVLDNIAKNNLIGSIAEAGNTGNVTVFTNGGASIANGVNLSTGEGMTKGQKYYTVRNIPNCQGMGDGVMTAVVNIYIALDFQDGCFDPSNNSLNGAVGIFKFSHPIYRGKDMLSGMFQQLEGIYYTIYETGGDYYQRLYVAENVENIPVITSTDGSTIYGDIGTAFAPIQGLKLVKNAFTGGGWVSGADYDSSIYAASEWSGAGQHTHECGYYWLGSCWGQGDSNGKPAAGKECVCASVLGCGAHSDDAGRSLVADHAATNVSDSYAGGFALYPISLG